MPRGHLTWFIYHLIISRRFYRTILGHTGSGVHSPKDIGATKLMESVVFAMRFFAYTFML